MNKVIRQGDVGLIQVSAIPAGAVEVKNANGNRIVLAFGEATGHAHAIYEDIDQVKVWAIGKVKYLEVMAGAMVTSKVTSTVVGVDGEPFDIGVESFPGVCLKHEEHTHHVIPPGIYKLPCQVEYSPAALQITRD